MKRILVPLDGSVFGEAALPCAEELARTAKAEIILVQSVTPHSLEIDLAETRSPHLSRLSEEYVEHATTAARDYLATMHCRSFRGGNRLTSREDHSLCQRQRCRYHCTIHPWAFRAQCTYDGECGQ
jgi:nucleotide-binding universal stress UspA family protein